MTTKITKRMRIPPTRNAFLTATLAVSENLTLSRNPQEHALPTLYKGDDIAS
jgi:hypothetical protein